MDPRQDGTLGEHRGQADMEVAISNGLVQLMRRFAGRGPTRARTTIGADVIVCVLGATLTQGERNLVDNQQDEVVQHARRAYQDLMRPQAIELVEQVTGRGVLAFMSANHFGPDLAAEVFVLRPRERADA
jgi:uncharacterized protein YbcI